MVWIGWSRFESTVKRRRKVNIELLEKVRSHILEEPRRLDMEDWIDYVAGKPESPACGTTGCIAGWAVLLTIPELIGCASDNSGLPEKFLDIIWNTNEEATRLLDLSEDEETRLFYLDEWPESYRLAYNAARSQDQKASVTASRISLFIQTKGTDITP